MHHKIELVKIIPDQDQIRLLFELLSRRRHSISHNTMPTYDQHIEFVQNNPYRAWFIIYEQDKAIGSVYVQFDNSIGLNVDDEISTVTLKNIIDQVKMRLSPLEAIPSLRYKDFFFNVAISNKKLQQKLEILGFKPSQMSYV